MRPRPPAELEEIWYCSGMALDTDKIDGAVLALLFLTLHDHWRAWKGFDWDALNRLYEKGLIGDPVNKAKSVVFTEEGLRRAEELFRAMFTKPARYTTLLRAIELWGAVQADGPRRLAGDEEPPAVDGFVVGREEDFSQQIKADPEDRLSAAFVGLDDDRPVFRLPFAGCVGECKGHGQHSEKLADPVGVNEVGVLEIEAPRLGGRKKRFDLPPPPIVGQGDLGIGVGGDYKQIPADQPRRGQFQRRSKRAVA